MAVPTNLQIGMVRRNSASAHKQRRKVNLIEAIKAIKLRAICSKLRRKSLSTVKMQQKTKNLLAIQLCFENYDYFCIQNLTILQMNNH